MKDPVALLEELVSFRSDVVGGQERPLADRLAALLGEVGADEVTVVDVPRAEPHPAAAYVYARFGRPRLLVNAHIDTVPPNAAWSSNPFVARIEDDRLYALGAADTKGAAAAILTAAAENRPRDVGILFSGDEEFSSVAMRAFVVSAHRAGLEQAIVCEPTNLRVGSRHRGFTAFDVTVSGPGGHSSHADAVLSPLALLARLGVAFDAWGLRHRTLGPPGFPGMCVNLAKLDGGVAFNVIPAEGRLLVSVRPPPGADTKAVLAELAAITREVVPTGTFRLLRDNATFATRDVSSFAPLVGTRGAPVDLGFWTEAALLSAHGVDAVVLGPGDITQAHGPDEWVTLEELHAAHDLFRAIFAVC